MLAGTYGYVVTAAGPTIEFNSALCTEPTDGSLPQCLPSETLAETGSASFYPLANLWIKNFTKLYPNVQINTQNTASGTGQAFVEKGLVQIGGSSIYLTDDQEHGHPNILNIPVAVTADIIDYNIRYPNGTEFPTSIHLNFTAPLLSQIYNSTVIYWDDPRITALNPGVARLPQTPKNQSLPHELIWPTYRSDAEGDSYVFTQYLSNQGLSDGDAWWNDTVYYGLTVPWPACQPQPPLFAACLSTAQSALGNPGIVLATGARAGSISYVSVEAYDQWVLCITQDPLCTGYAPLGHGLVENRAHHFVDATQDNINASIVALAGNTPTDERFPLTNAPGDYAYPMVGYEYVLVSNQQPSREFGLVLRAFLRYCLYPDYGDQLSFLGVYHFVPLPQAVLQLSLNQVSEITP